MMQPTHVFISYSRKDEDYRDDLLKQLTPLIKNQQINIWPDLLAGEEIENSRKNIENSNIILVLMSSDYVASEETYQELNIIIEESRVKDIKVIPILLRPFLIEKLAINELQSLPKGNRFLSDFEDKDAALRDIAEEIDAIVDNLIHQQSRPDPAEVPELEVLLQIADTSRQALHRKSKTLKLRHFIRPSVTPLAISLLVIFIRMLGLMQSLELAIYDSFFRLIPDGDKSDKILLIKISQEDIDRQEGRGELFSPGVESISNDSLQKAADKIRKLNPLVVGLDVYLESVDINSFVKPDQKEYFYTVCRQRQNALADGGIGGTGSIEPPENSLAGNIGYTDFSVDSDGLIRRYPLAFSPTENGCQTNFSFAFLVAKAYLQETTTGLNYPKDAEELCNNRNSYPFNNQFKIKFIRDFTGGYQALDNGGCQVLINYFSRGAKIADSFSLSDLLEDRINYEKYQNKIVLIGAIHGNSSDVHPTPFGISDSKKLPGVIIQAHMINQLIREYEEGSGMVKTWHRAFDYLLILCWGLIGAFIAFLVNQKDIRNLLLKYKISPAKTAPKLILVISGLGLYWLSFFVFWIWRLWLPYLPSVVSFLISFMAANRTKRRIISSHK